MITLPGPTWLILSESHKAIHVEFDEIEEEPVLTFYVFRADQREDDLGWELWDLNGFWPLRDWQEVHYEISGDLFDDGSLSWSTDPEKPAFYPIPLYAEGLAVAFAAIYSFGMRHFDFFEPKYRQMPKEVIEVPIEISLDPDQ